MYNYICAHIDKFVNYVFSSWFRCRKNELYLRLCELQFEFTNVSLSLNSSAGFMDLFIESLSMFPDKLFVRELIFSNRLLVLVDTYLRHSNLRSNEFRLWKSLEWRMLPPHLKLNSLTYSLCSFALLSKIRKCHVTMFCVHHRDAKFLHFKYLLVEGNQMYS